MKTQQFILLGPPGVQVREQASNLAERWQIPHISMTDRLREAIAQASNLGIEAHPYVDAGELVPDDVVVKLLCRRLEQPDAMLKGWVLDGFPCTVAQAQAFDAWWQAVGQSAATVVYLKAITGVLINRLWAERESDASMPRIRERLERHEAEIAPILAYYQERSQLTTINASLSFAEVARELAQLGQEDTGAARLIRNEAELDSLLTQQSMLVVDCMASWCGSCKQIAPSIDKLAETYGDRVTVTKIDFDVNRQITKRFGLKGIPAVMFFKDGELMETLIGVKSYPEYSAAIARLLN